MTIPPGHRFEATQALRQTLARAVAWGLLETNPAKVGVDNPLPPRREMLPFESHQQLKLLAHALGPRYGPMVLFAAATGLRPGEWLALERRDIDRDAPPRPRPSRLPRQPRQDPPRPTTHAPSHYNAPLSTRSTDSRPAIATPPRSYFQRPKAATSTSTTGGSATGDPPTSRPASARSGASTTSATFALHAGIGTFELSRHMGTSLVNIDRTYGHLTRDGHHRALALLDRGVDAGGRFVDAVASSTTAAARPETAR